MGVPLNMRTTVIVASAGLGLEGLGSAFIGPGADLGIITGAWVAMVAKLADQANVEIQPDKRVKLVGAILLGLGSFVGGTKLAVQAFAVTGIGTVPALVANMGINATITYLAGMAIARFFQEQNRIDSVETFAAAVISAVLLGLGFSAS